MTTLTPDNPCPFCDLDAARVRMQNAAAVAIPDAFPVSDGHMLVVPKRHVTSVFDLTDDEQAGLWRLVADVRRALLAELHSDGFNIGVNDGEAAGQTLPAGSSNSTGSKAGRFRLAALPRT